MKLSIKLVLSLGGIVFLMVFLGIFSIFQLNRVNASSTEVSSQCLPAIVAIEEANTLLSDFRVAEIQHVYSTEDSVMRTYEERMQSISENMKNRLRTYESFPMVSGEKRIYDEYQELHKKYTALHRSFIGLSRQNKTEEAIALLNGEGRELYFSMSAVLLQLVEKNVQWGKERSAEGDAIYANSFSSIMFLLAFAVAVAAGITFVLVRSVLKQLGKDPGALAQIARRVTDGDYAVDDGSPKIGVYGDIVNMVAALKEHIENARRESARAAEESAKAHEAMRQAEAAGAEAQSKTSSMLRAADKLEEVANIVSSASAELSAQIEQSERGAAEQAARVTETATAMEEMNSTVIEVAKNAGEASEMSTKTRQEADDGAGIVRKAVESIRQVQEESLALKEDMGALDEHARSISQIMGVISDIADQTNLLALNAAIEAARAGEAGRGFAVVADEVRKLAEKTMTSTTDVGNAIKAIQQSADKSMRQVDRAVKSVEEATEYANRSGEALEKIVTMADGTADQVRAIATASEQQSASSEEINQSITQVNTIAGETSRAMEEAARAVSDLAAQAQALAGLIEDMKRG